MGKASALYETDLLRWSEEQATAIRAAAEMRTNLPVDWENVAEEIESVGRSLKAELRSRLALVVEHLLKLQFSTATEPRRGWKETVARERQEIRDLLDDNPSLRHVLPGLVERAHHRGAELAALGLESHDELPASARREIGAQRYGEADLLGPWYPDEPR
jgi:hypothetical protein